MTVSGTTQLNHFWVDYSRHNDQRRSMEYYYTQRHMNINGKDILYFAVYDKDETMQLSAVLGICQTIGVCIILSLGAYLFTNLTSNMVIDPIEKMMERVKHITNDPLSAVHEEEERVLIDHLRSLQKKNKKIDIYEMSHYDDSDDGDDDDDNDGVPKKTNN